MSVSKLRVTLGDKMWMLNKNQEKFFRCDKKFVAYVGGRGGGKTLALILKVIYLCLKYPGNKGLIGRQDYSDLRDTTESDFIDVVYSVFTKGEVKHHKQEHRFVFANNSSVVFRGLKDVSKMSIRSLNLGFYALEQAEEIDEGVVDELDACLRHDIIDADGNKGIQQGFFLANPTLNWVFAKFKQEKSDERELIPCSMIDNIEHLSKSFITSMMNKSEQWKKVFVYGIFDEGILADRAIFHPPIMAKAKMYLHEPQRMTPRGICIYEEVKTGHKYQIGADPTEGITDNCAAKCVDITTGKEVASFVGRIQPEPFAERIEVMGKMYNNAKIVLEINGIGLATLTKLKDYPNMFMREDYDKRAKVMTEKLGWKTTSSTKPLLVDNYIYLIDNDFVKIADEKTYGEMRTFVYSSEAKTRGMGAEGRFHDDRIIATMLAYWDLKPFEDQGDFVIGGQVDKEKDLYHLESFINNEETSWLEM